MPPPIATCELQGYWYAAQQLMGLLSWMQGRTADARAYLAAASELKTRFNRDWWHDEDEFFALAMDPQKRLVRAASSNVGHCLAAGIIDADHVPARRRPVRQHRSVAVASPTRRPRTTTSGSHVGSTGRRRPHRFRSAEQAGDASRRPAAAAGIADRGNRRPAARDARHDDAVRTGGVMKPALKPISDQVIVITGASSGIGLVTAQHGREGRRTGGARGAERGRPASGGGRHPRTRRTRHLRGGRRSRFASNGLDRDGRGRRIRRY